MINNPPPCRGLNIRTPIHLQLVGLQALNLKRDHILPSIGSRRATRAPVVEAYWPEKTSCREKGCIGLRFEFWLRLQRIQVPEQTWSLITVHLTCLQGSMLLRKATAIHKTDSDAIPKPTIIPIGLLAFALALRVCATYRAILREGQEPCST